MNISKQKDLPTVPGYTAWGKVQSVRSIDDGIYIVSTATHGGLIAHHSVAKKVFSKAALDASFRHGAFYCFEEDSAINIPLYELGRVSWKDVKKDLFTYSFTYVAEVIGNRTPLEYAKGALNDSEKARLIAEIVTSRTVPEVVGNRTPPKYAKGTLYDSEQAELLADIVTSRTVPADVLAIITDPAFDCEQMKVFFYAIEQGLSFDKISTFTETELPAWEMLTLCKGLISGKLSLDETSILSNPAVHSTDLIELVSVAQVKEFSGLDELRFCVDLADREKVTDPSGFKQIYAAIYAGYSLQDIEKTLVRYAYDPVKMYTLRRGMEEEKSLDRLVAAVRIAGSVDAYVQTQFERLADSDPHKFWQPSAIEYYLRTFKNGVQEYAATALAENKEDALDIDLQK